MSKKVYVEQSAVLEALQAAINKQAGKPDALQFVSDILDAPFVPPPANVKPVVMGEWITVSESAWDGNEYKCSACGWKCCDDEFGDDPTEDYRFCPNCGADMRKEENDEP